MHFTRKSSKKYYANKRGNMPITVPAGFLDLELSKEKRRKKRSLEEVTTKCVKIVVYIYSSLDLSE